ncbi:MAG: pyridoxamine 5'-phosphate oxidase family protein [Spirochaetes bacterium]|nr:pyridoxamine 5'-phosphate oxidase family protein [Spirochaetota bacterium]
MEKKEIMDKILSLYDECFVFYLATVDENGIPGIRAIENLRYSKNFPEMADSFKGMEKSFDTCMATFKSSNKTKDMERTGKATIYFNNPPEFFGVSMYCDVVFLDDPESKKKYWAEKFKYFWTGTDDPEYKVMKLVPFKVDGWTGEHQFHYDL